MNENTNEVQEPKVDLTAGEMLRNARTTGRRKREIQTVAKQLCIREEFLQALEDGNYTFIPETVYILGFARNYAMELGLDPDEIVTKIKREMGLIQDETPAADDADAAIRGGAIVGAKAVQSVVKPGMFARAYQFVYQNLWWFVGGFVALVVIIVGLLVFVGGSDKNTSANPAPVAAVVSSDRVEPEYKMAVRERFGTGNRNKADVILQMTKAAGEIGSFVRVEDGRGNSVFSRVMLPGDVYYVPNGDRYTGTFNDAGAVDVWVNGKLAPKLGPNDARKENVSLAPSKLMAGDKK